MNYEKIYTSLILKRLMNKIDRSQCYCEYHHIKPRSIYPELIDEQTNIVALTAKEHYVAHHLLMHWYKELYGQFHDNYYKMLLAFQYTANIQANNLNFITARLYEFIKEERSKISLPDYVRQKLKDNHADVSNDKNPAYGRRTLFNIKTQEKYFCKKDEVQKYLNNGWVSIYDIKLFNNGKIEVFDIKCPNGFKPGHLKIQTECEKILEHLNRSNPQIGKRFMYNPNNLKIITAKLNEIQKYLNLGYIFGRPLKRKTTKGYIWIKHINTGKKKRVSQSLLNIYLNNGYKLCEKEYWWNNGNIEIRSSTKPDDTYILGHLPSIKTVVIDGIKITLKKVNSKRVPIINKITCELKYVLECFLPYYEQKGFIRKFKSKK